MTFFLFMCLCGLALILCHFTDVGLWTMNAELSGRTFQFDALPHLYPRNLQSSILARSRLGF